MNVGYFKVYQTQFMMPSLVILCKIDKHLSILHHLRYMSYTNMNYWAKQIAGF